MEAGFLRMARASSPAWARSAQPVDSNAHKAPRPQKGVDNDEIRLSVLCQCYINKFKGKGWNHPHELELQNVDEITRDVNLEYLIDKGLLNGHKLSANGRVIIPTVSITAWGMDVVEDIMKQSLDKLEPNLRKEVEREGDTHKMLDRLYEKCVKSAPACADVVKATHAILAALGHA